MPRGRRRRRSAGRRRLEAKVEKVEQGVTPGGRNNQIQFNSNNTFSGSTGLTFDGSSLELTGTLSTQGNLGINTSGVDPTHGITLPDTSNTTGQVKANSFVTYSSIRFKILRICLWS